ncbi:hypothetical protein B0I35DRAFT_475655 [Stachybotrys elegans]|uniref:chitin synthase n=1 Tax=Stachybotrys elegans TaxID=80388 RepID=A0A8K0WTM8_9HYPO|nr:hypothetical protein B0I35DRAFT_475655 [Stachybotrys elegans]
MDPLSIISGCAGLITALGSASVAIHNFIRTCRDARADLDKVSRELHSLRTVLELVRDDAKDDARPFPPPIAHHIVGIVANCNGVVAEIRVCINKYSDGRVRSKAAWALSGQGDMDKLRSSIEAHKSALELALDMLNLQLTREVKNDTTAILGDTTAIKDDTGRILEEIARLQARLPQDTQSEATDFLLQKYLEEMTTYTEMALEPTSPVQAHDSISLGDFEPRSSNLHGVEPLPGSTRNREEHEVNNLRSHPNRSSPRTPESSQEATELVGMSALPWNDVSQIVWPLPAEPPDSRRATPSPKLEHGIQEPETPSQFSLYQSDLIQRTGAPTPGRRHRRQQSDWTDQEAEPYNRQILGQHEADWDWTTQEAGSHYQANPGVGGSERRGAIALPRQKETGLSLMTWRGNLIIDLEMPAEILSMIPHGERDEFTHWRHTPLTCNPLLMRQRRFSLRQSLFAKPRQTFILLFFTLKPDDKRGEFALKWRELRLRLAYLTEKIGGEAAFTGWKRIVVHVHSESPIEDLGPPLLDLLANLGIKRTMDTEVDMLDEQLLPCPYTEKTDTILNKSIEGIISEYTTQLQVDIDYQTGLQVASVRQPIQVIFTYPKRGFKWDDTTQQWSLAIAGLLDAQCKIDVSSWYWGSDKTFPMTLLVDAWEALEKDKVDTVRFFTLATLKEHLGRGAITPLSALKGMKRLFQ